MEDIKKSVNEICDNKPLKIVISNKKNKDVNYNKIVILLKEKNKKEYYQIEKYTDKQVFHENIEKKELKEKIEELFVSILFSRSFFTVSILLLILETDLLILVLKSESCEST